MKRIFYQIGLICLSVFFLAEIAFSQTPVPTARPLPKEFFQRRDASNAFEYGKYYLQQKRLELYPEAIKNFEIALKIYDEFGDKANVGCALLGIGLAESRQGKTFEATWTYNRALAIFRTLKGENINSKALAQLGFLYDVLVGKRKPFEYKSLEIQPPKKGYDQDGNKIDYRFSQTSFRYFIEFFNQPFIFFVSPYKPGEDVFDDPRYAGYSEYPEPVNFSKDILGIWKLNGFDSLQVATRINLMETWADTNRPLAIFYGKQAINNYQEIRRNLKKDNPRDVLRYYNLMPNKFRFLADLLIANGQFAEAEQVLQMLKEEEFSEFIKRDADEIKDLNQRVALNEKERELIKRYSDFADKIAEIGQEFLSLDDKKRKLAEQKQMLSTDEQSRYEQLSAKIKDANDSFKLFIEKDLSRELNTNTTKNIELDRDLQAKLRRRGDGTVAIYTVITENRCRVFLTTPTVQVDGKTEIKAEELNKKIFEFRDALQNKKIDPRILGKEIYDILLKPIEKELKASNAKTLVWSLDGVLRYIPLAALSPDGKSYLVEEYQNVLLTSKTREDLPNRNIEWRALGMGVSQEQEISYPEMPNEIMVMNSIPAVKDELLAIIQDENNPKETGIFKGKRFLDEEFTVANLEKSLAVKYANGKKKFNVVHFASHFRLGGNWSESFLLLGNSKILTLENFANMPTMNFDEVELVTLSACKTGISSEPNGKEIESLAGAIQAKGGRTVLATLWDVVDESTSLLMSNFYRLKKENPNMTKAEALQLAQKELITGNIRNGKPRFAHPYYWSPFVIFGNWR